MAQPTEAVSGIARMQLRVAETVAAELRERILANRIPEGPLPKQETLMAEFGVSAPSIREALRILDTEGLITVRRGKVGGAIVHRPNASTAAFAIGLALQGQGITLHDLAAAVLDFEPLCVGSCAAREDRATAVVPLLERNIAQTEVLIDHPDDFTRVAREFHRIIVEHTTTLTSRMLVQALVEVWSVQEETWASLATLQGTYPRRDRRLAAVKAHKDVLRLIAAGDAEVAIEHHRAHLRATQLLVLEAYGDAVVDAASPRAIRGFRSLKVSP